MRDLPPEALNRYRRIEYSFLEAAACWGYEEVRTPTIERLPLFTAAGTLSPEMLSRTYSFLDWDGWSGERVVLRPDSTIPTARLVSESGLPLPARLCYVQQVFRFEPGEREREEWQCGVELVGSGDVDADAEVVTVLAEALRGLGLGVSVRASHTGIARDLYAASGCTQEQAAGFNEEAREAGIGAFRRLPDEDGTLATVLGLLERVDSLDFLRGVQPAISAHLPSLDPALSALLRFGDVVCTSAEIRPDASLLRDFDYYTGLVFEIEVDGQLVGAGGEYDGVYELIAGTPAQATGGVLFVDRLAERRIEAWPERDAVPVRGPGLTLRAQLRQMGRALRNATPGELAIEMRPDGLVLSTGGEEAQPVADLEEALAVLKVVS
jgi:histidyl-tRNA synthetase